MKKRETVYICDNCGKEIEVKGLLFSPYVRAFPDGWTKLGKEHLCPKCSEIYRKLKEETYDKRRQTMSNNQEVMCNKCVHYEVCTHKDTYLKIWKTILNQFISVSYLEEAEIVCKGVGNSDFIKDIKVECKYYQNKEVNFYGTK